MRKFEKSGGKVAQGGDDNMDKRGKRTFGQPVSHGTIKGKVTVDANSERNAEFYSQEGVVTVYPKDQVYPKEGGEVQLEQLRARLPQYCPPAQDELAGDNMEVSMELTMACISNTTILPGPKRDKENACAVPRPGKGVGTRQPLQPLLAPRHSSLTHTTDSERLRGELVGASRGAQQPQGILEEREEEEEEEGDSETISELLDNMMLQQSAERQQQRDGGSAGVARPGGGGVVGVQKVAVSSRNPLQDQENLSSLVDQENRPQPPPAAVYKPHTSVNSSRGCVTRLNFSDAESSLCTSQLNSLMEDSVGGRGSILSHSRVRSHEQSGAGQSFEVFHDSFKGELHNASYGRPEKTQPAVRQRPLERKSGHEGFSLAESYQSYDQSYSFQTGGVSKGNMSSFSAYEDTVADQSSFAPFHDSWANSSKDVMAASRPESVTSTASGVGQQQQVPGRALRPVSAQSGQMEEREGEMVYHTALGVPLAGGGGGARLGSGSGSGGVVNSSIIDQSFTQVGICHPKVPPTISTPLGKNIDLMCDLSRIQSETEVVPPQPLHQQHDGSIVEGVVPSRKRSYIQGPINLSTIKEESSSFKSSRSSNSSHRSSTTVSSSSSSSSSSTSSVGHDSTSPPDINVNPFSPEIVNMMLNAMTPAVVEGVCRVPGALPQLVSGRTVRLGQQEFTGLKKMTSGGFGTIYSCRDDGESKVLKVQKPAMQWEMAIISELHTRLSSSKLMAQCFVSAEKTFVFNNASVMVLPHYKHGSLLDFANNQKTQFCQSLLFYYTAEVLEMVAILHHCGILHTDIKPDNFMLTDISRYKNAASAFGNGLVLIDFGRAVDLTVFPPDTMFQGSCETEGFQCTQMLEGKPWKYEADYFGIAATVHVLLTGEYMSVQKNPQTNLYQLSKPFRRLQCQSLWEKVFSCLLNTTHPLPLADMAAEMRTRLNGLKDYVFHAFCVKTFTALQKKQSQVS